MSADMLDRTLALRAALQGVMAIEDVTEGVPVFELALLGRRRPRPAAQGPAVRFRGRLLMAPEQAYELLAQRFQPLGYTPLLRREQPQQQATGPLGWASEVVLAIPGTLRQANQRIGLAAGLFVLTVLSSLFAGAQMVEGLTGVNWNLLDGLPFAVSLLAILGAHEFGHYLVARRLGTPVSLPYFIPMPVGPFGTLGAFINMTAPPRNRRHLLAIATAGPLAGLVLAVPILWIGLKLSHVTPLPAGPYMLEGNSLLYAALKYLAFGRFLPSNGEDVFIHQVAFAGWAGLLVTGLNLIPAGQLDGGHIVYALVGEKRAQIALWIVLAGLALLSVLWQGWLLWFFLVFVFGRLRAAPLDDLTELTSRQRVLGVFMVIVFVLVFTPIPLTVVSGS